MKQEDSWTLHYQAVHDFLLNNNRNPSRHHPEESKLLNWLKYNRKLKNKNLLPPHRKERLMQLIQLGQEMHQERRKARSKGELTPQDSL